MNINDMRSSKITPRQNEVVKDLVKKSKGLFEGHSISWTKIGDSRWERFKNYFKSCADTKFAEAIKAEFWDWMKTSIEDELCFTLRTQTQSLGLELLENIASIQGDMPEMKKMELILRVSELTEISATQNEHVKKAENYFKNKKEEIVKPFNKIMEKMIESIEKNDAGYLRSYQKELDDLKTISETAVKSEQDLKDLQKIYAEKFIDAWKPILNHSWRPISDRLPILIDETSFIPYHKNEFLENIANAPEEEISEIKKMELILRFAENDKKLENNDFKKAKDYFEDKKEEAIETIDKISGLGGDLATDLNKKSLEKIRTDFLKNNKPIKSEADLKEFQTDYAKAVIKEMKKICKEDPIPLTHLKRNVESLLTKEPGIIIEEDLSNKIQPKKITKEEAMEIIAARKEKQRIFEIMPGIIFPNELGLKIDPKIPEKQEAPNDLAKIESKYQHHIVNNQKELDSLKMNYVKEIIKEVSKHDKKTLEILNKNITKLINDKRMGFSEDQKAEIRNYLFIESRFPDETIISQDEKDAFIAQNLKTDENKLEEKLYKNYPMTKPQNRSKEAQPLLKIEKDNAIQKVSYIILNNMDELISLRFPNPKYIEKFDAEIDKIYLDYDKITISQKEDVRTMIKTAMFNEEKNQKIKALSDDNQAAFLQQYPQFKSIPNVDVYRQFEKALSDFQRQINLSTS
ncbi:hypothetical protein AYO37_00620 [Opitutia bacterium SCGC AG-212-L18]|nr:hypothetical protein AYO37_00620 [Opitutae bacterium SCGC AG-212-L18]